MKKTVLSCRLQRNRASISYVSMVQTGKLTVSRQRTDLNVWTAVLQWIELNLILMNVYNECKGLIFAVKLKELIKNKFSSLSCLCFLTFTWYQSHGRGFINVFNSNIEYLSLCYSEAHIFELSSLEDSVRIVPFESVSAWLHRWIYSAPNTYSHKKTR